MQRYIDKIIDLTFKAKENQAQKKEAENLKVKMKAQKEVEQNIKKINSLIEKAANSGSNYATFNPKKLPNSTQNIIEDTVKHLRSQGFRVDNHVLGLYISWKV